MCGIYGMVSLAGARLQFPEAAHRLSANLAHRGPDGAGEHQEQDAVLGARRLRIIDRRLTADQPYVSCSAKALVCNGEIYNAGEIRDRFPNFAYRSRTDVECVLPLVDRYGVAGLSALDGMFAMAIWDEKAKTLWLARDRAGEKPLFYIIAGNEAWFASEMHALLAHPQISRRLDQDALHDYLTFGFVREPRTMYRDIRKVPAGHLLEVTGAGITVRPIDSDGAHAHGASTPYATGDSLLTLLDTSVRKQLRADVPIGVFLSGGIDSSLVTALASRQQPDIHSFTVRFKQRSYDEGLAAREAAAAFRTHHHEVFATYSSLGRALDILTREIAEPVSDPAILPTILLAEEARRHVGVVLSGEGSDELFGGYPTYLGHRWASVAAAVPKPLVNTILRLVGHRAAAPGRVTMGMLIDRFLRHAGLDDRARHITWFGTGLFPFLSDERRAATLASLDECADPVSWAMQTDYQLYLREGLLTKLDRATMRWGLEARAPFLDREIVAFARGLPADQKAGYFRTKVHLTRAAAAVLPRRITRRRKRGLSVPIAGWINGDLKPDVDRLLEPRRIANQATLPDLPMTRLLREHRSGQANHARALWALVVLQSWLDHSEGKTV